MKILLWHVHGSWTTSFVQGPDEYLIPLTPDRGPDGRGRAQTWDWPASVTELPHSQLRRTNFDVVLLQRPHELELAAQWTGKRPGIDVPAVYVEHNTPRGPVTDTVHPIAHRSDIQLVHVTNFNQLFWDNGSAPNRVIEHGIVDPGYLYTGELPRAAVAINEPVRRNRITGTDLLAHFAQAGPIDVFGMGLAGLIQSYGLDPELVSLYENVPQQQLHRLLAKRAVYVHTARWTSLGLSLLEAMHLGLPVVVLGTTEAAMAVPPEAGCVSTDIRELQHAMERFISDPQAAQTAGQFARGAALKRYGLQRFLDDWQCLLKGVFI